MGTSPSQVLSSAAKHAWPWYLKATLYWTLPSIFCLAVWWSGLWCWFQRDDFAWLGLHRGTAVWPGLWRVLFMPMAQGTIRTLSERGFFLAFWHLFGLNAFPYRLLVFATQFLNIVLVTSVVRRLTRSSAAGFWAAVFWAANSALNTPMTWTSAYNEVLCTTFILSAFQFLLLYLESGRRRYQVLEWAAFILGFGALELNVVYPAIASAYLAVTDRRRVWRTVPMWLVSIVYSGVHTWVAPPPQTGVYALVFDSRLFSTIRTYWRYAFRPDWWLVSPPLPRALNSWSAIVLPAVLVAFVLLRAKKRDWVPVFLLAWFGLAIAPVLPLPDHISDYYLTIPLIGLCALGGWAAASAWRHGHLARLAVLLLGASYLSQQVCAAHVGSTWYYDQSQRVRRLVARVSEIHGRENSKPIFLIGADSDLYYAIIKDKCFEYIDIPNVYLAPHVKTAYWEPLSQEEKGVKELTPSQSVVLKALGSGRATVLDVTGDRVMKVDAFYLAEARRQWRLEVPRSVAIGDELYSDQLGDGWFPSEGNFRWMSKLATLTLGGPAAPSQRLYLTVYVPRAQLKQEPLAMQVRVDDRPVGSVEWRDGDKEYTAPFDLPGFLVGRESVKIAIEVNRTIMALPDTRELGVAVIKAEIR